MTSQATSLLRLQAIETGHSLLQVWRLPAFSVPTLLFPLMFYALFGLLLPSKTGNAAPAHYLLATYGAFAVIGPALFGFGVGSSVRVSDLRLVSDQTKYCYRNYSEAQKAQLVAETRFNAWRRPAAPKPTPTPDEVPILGGLAPSPLLKR